MANTENGNGMDKSAVLIRASREMLLPLLILVAFASLVLMLPRRTAASGIRFTRDSGVTIDIRKDPYSQLLLENSYILAYALTLPPGSESSLQSEHNFLTVTPENSEIIMWKDGESPIQHYHVRKGEIHFYLGPSARGIRNDAKAEYRNVIIEFLDPQVTNYGYRYNKGKWDYGPSVSDQPVDPEGNFANSLDLETAVAKDIQLLSRETLPSSDRPRLLVAVTSLELSLGERKIKLKPCEVMWLESREPGLQNESSAAARFALVEFKAPGNKYKN